MAEDIYERAAAQIDAAATSPASSDGVILVNGRQIKPTPIMWAWRHWLALGKLHILAGAPGQGKTTLVLAMLATVTIGGRWPDGTRADAGNVLVWSGEDDPADTLLPRLMAMGADVARVFFVKGTRLAGEDHTFDPARDLVALTSAAEKIGNVRMVMVDPVVTAVTADSHKNTEVRRALKPLVDLAACLNAAVVGVSHFSKGSAGRDPTERVVGSVAFSAVARVVMVAAKAKDEDGRERRILARSKSNVGPDEGGFSYSIDQIEVPGHPGIFASRVLWGEAIEGTARQILADAESEDTGRSAKESAVDWLRDFLEGAPILSDQVKAESKEAGLSWATVRRAADEIGVIRRKGGMNAGWYWSLPTAKVVALVPRPRPEDAQDAPKVLTQKNEHLRQDLSTFDDPVTEPDDDEGAI